MSYLPRPQENWLISGIQSHPSLFTICCMGIIAIAAIWACSNAKVPKLQIKRTNNAFLDKSKGNRQKLLVAISKALLATATGELTNQWHPVKSIIVHDLLPKKDEWSLNVFEGYNCASHLVGKRTAKVTKFQIKQTNKHFYLVTIIKGLTYLPPPQENWLISGIQSHPSLFTICCLKKDEWTLQQQNKQKIKYLYVRIALRSQYA